MIIRTRGKKAWQGNGTLRVGSTTEAAQFQADFNEPGYYTIQFDLQLPLLPANQLVLPRAEITWAVEGTFVRRLISLSRGNVISGAGQGVTVKMFDYSLLVAPPDIEYFVSAQVVKGTRPNQAGSRPPILLAGIGAGVDPRGANNNLQIATTAIATWFVPPDAGITGCYVLAGPSLAAATAAIPSNGFTITQQVLSAGLVLSRTNYDQLGVWIPLNPSCQALSVQNNTPDTYDVSVIWGVEG